MQSGVLNIIFRIADDRGLLLLDFKDLRAITQFIGDNAKSFQNQYGNINSASIGAIQRRLLTWSNRAPSTSSASRCWILPTGCASMPAVKG